MANGEAHRADSLTKSEDYNAIARHVEWTDQYFEVGRHDLVPNFNVGQANDELTDDPHGVEHDDQLGVLSLLFSFYQTGEGLSMIWFPYYRG